MSGTEALRWSICRQGKKHLVDPAITDIGGSERELGGSKGRNDGGKETHGLLKGMKRAENAGQAEQRRDVLTCAHPRRIYRLLS